MATLQEQIHSINERLRAFGIEAIQEVKMTDKGGNQIGQIKYGFRPQCVFDSVNEVLGPENWRYELTKEEIFETQAVQTRKWLDAEGVTRFTTEIIAREMKILGGGERTDMPVPPEDGQYPPPSDDVPF